MRFFFGEAGVGIDGKGDVIVVVLCATAVLLVLALVLLNGAGDKARFLDAALVALPLLLLLLLQGIIGGEGGGGQALTVRAEARPQLKPNSLVVYTAIKIPVE